MFLRSEDGTRYVRLSPLTQAAATTGVALVAGWAIVASAILAVDGIGAGGPGEAAANEERLYEERLNALSAERDARAAEARAAQERFAAAVAQVSQMQSLLLAAEDRSRELSAGIEVVQGTLARTLEERDAARDEASQLVARIDAEADDESVSPADMARVTATLSETLSEVAQERDGMAALVQGATSKMDEMALEMQLADERAARIFTKIESAVDQSMGPLNEMFGATGLPTDSIIASVRRSYSGQGGPLTNVAITTSGDAGPLADRAGGVMERLDRLNLYRLAADTVPFAHPVKGQFRQTSGFGPRWGRIHKGLDFAGARGTAIHATADGTVVFAGRQSGYGKLVKIRHAHGLETRFAHLSAFRVSVGDKVSRGDRIGDMGNTGRSTGTHLHYEVRVNGEAVDPMTYIKAARDVF